MFERLKWVSNVVSGCAGGTKLTAHYEIVEAVATGHAEPVEITYDPSEISRPAQTYIQQLNGARILERRPDFSEPHRDPVVPLQGFYPSEAEHQHFLERHAANPYIVFNGLPKLKQLQKQFPALVKSR